MSSSLQPHGLQHARPPCPSLSPGVCSNSGPLSRWYHPTISSSVPSFSSCPRSFPTSVSFPMSQLFISGGQSIGASASASVVPMNIQGWFPLGLTGLISLVSKGELQVKTIMRYKINAGEDVEKRETSCTVGGKTTTENSMEIPLKKKKLGIKLPYDPAIPLGHMPWENHNSKSHMYASVHCSTIYNSQDMEATQKFINRWMHKEIVVHIYYGVVLSHKKEQNWVSCREVDGARVWHTAWSQKNIV